MSVILFFTRFIKVEKKILRFCFELCLNNESNLEGNGDVFIRLTRETPRNDNFKLYFNRFRNSSPLFVQTRYYMR